MRARYSASPPCPRVWTICGSHSANIFGPARSAHREAGVWQARQELFDNSEATVLKVSLPTSEICSVISELRQFAVREGLDVEAVAQATGLMTVAVRAAPDAVVRLPERLRARVAGFRRQRGCAQVPERGARRASTCGGRLQNALPLMRGSSAALTPTAL